MYVYIYIYLHIYIYIYVFTHIIEVDIGSALSAVLLSALEKIRQGATPA